LRINNESTNKFYKLKFKEMMRKYLRLIRLFPSFSRRVTCPAVLLREGWLIINHKRFTFLIPPPIPLLIKEEEEKRILLFCALVEVVHHMFPSFSWRG
jgi:hypothetical protein